jgi:Ca-activated chloride channel family protein
MTFRWESPDAFHWIWFVLVLFVFVIWANRKNRKKMESTFAPKILNVLVQSRSMAKRRLKWLLQTVAFVLAICSLARPQFGESAQSIKSQGVELIVALDVSNSMMAEDMKPSRLEQARNEITRLMDQLAGDKVGLIAFAGSAVLISPLTNDYSSIKTFLETTGPISVTTQGTNFKAAIDQAVAAMKRGGLDQDDGVRTTKVLLFVTDGEQTTGDAMAAAKEALSKGIRIFALGLGTKAGAPIPARDEFGNLQGYKKDKEGKTVLSTANEEKLTQLAQAGGGAYYHSDFSGQAIKSIKSDLDRMEKSEFESQDMVNYDERFQLPLLFAILILFLEMILSERRSGTVKWKGRFEISVLAFFFLGLVGTQANAGSLKSVFRNRKALEHMAKENWPEANRELSEGIVEDSSSAELYYNLGQTYEENQEFEKALQSYKKSAELASDPDLKYQAHFNSARLLGEQKQIEEAIEEYQSALDQKPDSIEAKTNIELLLSQGGGGGSGGDKKDDKKGDKSQSGNQEKQEDSEGDKKQKEQPKDKPGDGEKKKPQPKPFQSQELSQQEVKNILDELRRQEEQVRAKLNDKKVKETPVDKDW